MASLFQEVGTSLNPTPITTGEEPGSGANQPGSFLGPTEIRALAERLGIRPTKTWGQNFVHDANTVRRIVQRADLGPDDHVLEVGPGLGSLTLGMTAVGAQVTAVEIDPTLAQALPDTMAAKQPQNAHLLTVIAADALALPPQENLAPTALVANLPYNVAVPVLLTMLERFPSLTKGLVMVQAEVADRLAAPPGSRTYGAPSVKMNWFAQVRRDIAISRQVFWPVPRVDSALVAWQARTEPPAPVSKKHVFAVIDAAFAQRRKALRPALASWAGSAAHAEQVIRAAGLDPMVRGERLRVEDFCALVEAKEALAAPDCS